ncbi:maleylacetoacetate isomerase [Facilibium subflavum]|uniref:maleylacetoacetate isomerase n=1 Tax=Facilibium subflavum TaxID=2219058 RepID=UPI000E650B1C|nr:maleylacetoacetate isomerase [Facilibium subflavum]
MILYDYFRSSASYRVRIVLNLKNITYQTVPIHLVKDGGQQFSPKYQVINPQKRVPALQDGDFIVTQSLAIIDYLEDCYPAPSIYPKDVKCKSQVKSMAQLICCDIHPLNNLAVLNYLTDMFKVDTDEKTTWYQHWIIEGFTVIEQQLRQSAGLFCFGDKVSLADVCLIPQIYNAKRFDVDMDPFPIMNRIYQHALLQEAFFKASPEQVELAMA